jgi:NADPH:quinone reductase-like Zn-dependent oxidoreductase
MKAARLPAYGDVSQFKVEEVPTPTPGAGEVLIKVEASALNHIDLFVPQGYMPMALAVANP